MGTRQGSADCFRLQVPRSVVMRSRQWSWYQLNPCESSRRQSQSLPRYWQPNSTNRVTRQYTLLAVLCVQEQVCVPPPAHPPVSSPTLTRFRDPYASKPNLRPSLGDHLAQIMVLNAPSFFNTLFAAVKPLLNEATKKKIDLLPVANAGVEMLKAIPAESLPVHYGGTSEVSGGRVGRSW